VQANLTILAAKPHVATFIRKASMKDGLPRIQSKSILFNAIKGNLTPKFEDRMDQVPEGMEKLRILLPHRYRTLYMAADHVHDLAISLEEYFWFEFELYVLKKVAFHSDYKDHAIRQFAQEYEITESIYSLGSFRRRLHRSGIRGIQPPVPDVEPRISRVLTNQECWQMYRVWKERKVGYRKLSSAYKIGLGTCHEILKKISEKVSKFRTDPEQNYLVTPHVIREKIY